MQLRVSVLGPLSMPGAREWHGGALTGRAKLSGHSVPLGSRSPGLRPNCLAHSASPDGKRCGICLEQEPGTRKPHYELPPSQASCPNGHSCSSREPPQLLPVATGCQSPQEKRASILLPRGKRGPLQRAILQAEIEAAHVALQAQQRGLAMRQQVPLPGLPPSLPLPVLPSPYPHTLHRRTPATQPPRDAVLPPVMRFAAH